MNKEECSEKNCGGLLPWDHPVIYECLKRQCLPDGTRRCSICRREQGPEARVRFLAYKRLLAYKNDTQRFLFLLCQRCNESPLKFQLVLELVRRGEGLIKNC